MKKLYILDTNVLIHDPSSLYEFQDNDIYIPLTVLEELDSAKKGLDGVARNARAANRNLEKIISSGEKVRDDGVYEQRFKIDSERSLGVLMFEKASKQSLLEGNRAKGDNSILLSTLNILDLVKKDPQKTYALENVVLVSKDVNMRIKCLSLGVICEDYLSDYAISDSDLLPTGIHEVSADGITVVASSYESGSRWREFDVCDEVPVTNLYENEFIKFNGDYFRYKERTDSNSLKCTETENFKSKSSVWGLNARNDEQNLALNLLLDPDVSLFSLLGPAGTGKTIITLAAALELIFTESLYDEVIFSRATVNASHDIGFLPGTEEEKLDPWLGALHDSLDVLGIDMSDASQSQITQKVKIKSINFMRGRSFQRKFLVLDEAQNLTPSELKMLLTRAGEGTKVVLMGNLNQIDTPYLNEISSGLTHVVENLKQWKGSGHLILNETVRSELSEVAEKNL